MKTSLSACPGCMRHLRVTEVRCPFCGVDLPAAFRQQKAAPLPATRLSRAAMYALRAGALSMTTAACSGATTGGNGAGEEGDGATDAAPVVDAAYGGPPTTGMDGSIVALYGGFFGADGSAGALYGGFIGPVDAGDDGPEAGPTDAAPTDDGPTVAPPYGRPPL